MKRGPVASKPAVWMPLSSRQAVSASPSPSAARSPRKDAGGEAAAGRPAGELDRVPDAGLAERVVGHDAEPRRPSPTRPREAAGGDAPNGMRAVPVPCRRSRARPSRCRATAARPRSGRRGLIPGASCVPLAPVEGRRRRPSAARDRRPGGPRRVARRPTPPRRPAARSMLCTGPGAQWRLGAGASAHTPCRRVGVRRDRQAVDDVARGDVGHRPLVAAPRAAARPAGGDDAVDVAARKPLRPATTLPSGGPRAEVGARGPADPRRAERVGAPASLVPAAAKPSS